MVAATAELKFGETLIAGAISGLSGGIMERSIQGVAHYGNWPGQVEEPT